MFHVAIMEKVAAGQQSDRLQAAELARLFKEAQLNKSKPGTGYLQSMRDFVNGLRLNGREQMTANKVDLATQEC